MIALLMYILILIVVAFLQNVHPLHLPPSDAESFKMNADPSEFKGLKLDKVMEPTDVIKNKRRFRRSYGQKSKCIPERKTFCEQNNQKQLCNISYP